MPLTQHPTGSMVPVFSRFVLSGAAISLALGSANALTCHCLNNSPCNPDGSCPNGCDKGWYGPGCQLGNLALGKPASQSSTFSRYTAGLAVNGVMPPLGDPTESNCSHTAESTSAPLWWYVQLSDSEDFVIKNVTIVNRQGIAAKFLRWIYILYTASVRGDPDPNTWNTCAYQASTPSSIQTTFTCNGGTAIGRRVAVYIGSHPEEIQMLILCEVYVDGYAYKEASSFQDIRISVTPRCDSIKVDFDTLPIVPPSFFYVNVRPSDGTSATRIERIRYPLSGTPSKIVPATPNRMYTIWVFPETCCIGSQCLNNVNEWELRSSYCVNGTSSGILITTTPQYEQYALTVSANTVNVTASNLYPCTASVFNIQCNRERVDTFLSSTSCNTLPCQLNPYYNYTCTVKVTFNDGFQRTFSNFSVNFGAADFSALDILARTTCDKVYVELRNITRRWNLNPSFIVFYKKTLVDNVTTVMRTPFGNSDNYAVEFAAVEDSEHSVWAAPEICWSKTVCANASDRACYDSAKCALGQNTAVKLTKTKVRQYSLKLKNCCLSLDDQSPDVCQNLDYLKITCSYGWNATYESSGVVGSTVCGLPEGSNYTCQIDARIGNISVKNVSYMQTNVSLSGCVLREPTHQQSFIVIIGGASGGGVLLIVLISLAVALPLRKRNAKKNANKEHTAEKHKDAGARNGAFIGEDHSSNYVYPDDESNESGNEDRSSQIHVAPNNDSEEYYVHHISEPPSTADTKETHSRPASTTAVQKGIASSSNDHQKQLKPSKTVTPEAYADYRLNSPHDPNSNTNELFQQRFDATAPPAEENGETEGSEYVNIQELQSALALSQPAGNVTYTNSDTCCESSIPNQSGGISYINSASFQTEKVERKPKAKKSGK